MAELRPGSFDVEDYLKYTHPLLYALGEERRALRELRLPMAENVDSTGDLTSYNDRLEKILKDRKKAAIDALREAALEHNIDVKIIGKDGGSINEENFSIVKGRVLQEIDRKMIEADKNSRVVASSYSGARVVS